MTKAVAEAGAETWIADAFTFRTAAEKEFDLDAIFHLRSSGCFCLINFCLARVITRMKRKEDLTFLERLYVLEVIKGVFVTGGHLVANFFKLSRKFLGLTKDRGIATYQYPDESRPYAPRYRGRHRLTLWDDGSVKCTSCYLCATACPANCIFIEPTEHEDPKVEKYPARYEIDTLLCVYCGYCVDACPVDAIRMDTGIHPEIYSSDPRSFVEDKETLMERSRVLEELGPEGVLKQHLAKMKKIEREPFAKES